METNETVFSTYPLSLIHIYMCIRDSVPMEALIDTASYYLGLENFYMQQVLEARIME